LQFEIVKYRLEMEYNAPSRLEGASWTLARWIKTVGTATEGLMLPSGARIARDSTGRPVLLFPNEWNVRYFQQNNKDVELSEYPASIPADKVKRVA
jgi:peptide chain release factor 3